MLEPIVYVDHSEVRDGKLDELKTAMKVLVEFVETNEPQILGYKVYFSPDGGRMTVMHAHSDQESLEFHMRVAGPQFAPLAELIKLQAIDIYGSPSDHAVEQLREKASMLGNGTVLVHELHVGFARSSIG